MKFSVMIFVEADSKEEAIAKRCQGKVHAVGVINSVSRPIPRVVAIPYKDWPIWAKALKLIAKPGDNGIGDVVARTIGKENSEAFKAWHLKTFGKPCDCTGRQTRWNKMYPLP